MQSDEYEQLPSKVTREELHKGLMKRADYHSGRAEDFNARAVKVRETKSVNGVKFDDVVGNFAAFGRFPGPFPGPDTVAAAAKHGLKAVIQGLRATAKRHEDRATTLRFYADHLPDGASFLLSPADLARFELLPPAASRPHFAPAMAVGVGDYIDADEEGVEIGGQDEGDGF